MKISLRVKYWVASCLLVFLLTLNFGGLKIPLYLATCYILPLWHLCRTKMVRKSGGLTCIFLCFLTYLFMLFVHKSTYLSVVVMIAAFPLAYLLGQTVIQSAALGDADAFKVFKYMIFSAAFGLFLYNVLSYATGRISTANIFESRYVRDFWTGELTHPTNFNNRCLFVLCLLFFGIHCSESLIEKVIILVSQALVLYYSVNTASRTNIVLMLAVYGMAFVYWRISGNKRLQKKSSRKQRGMAVLVVLCAAALIISKWDVITAWYQTSNLMARSSLSTRGTYDFSGDGRLALWAEVIGKMWDYPFGNMPTSAYAHNLFLDVCRTTGVIPMVLLMASVLYILAMLLRLLRDKSVDRKYKCLAFSVILGSLGSFMIEPVIEGRPMNLLVFFLIAGMIEELVKHSGVQAVDLER